MFHDEESPIGEEDETFEDLPISPKLENSKIWPERQVITVFFSFC